MGIDQVLVNLMEKYCPEACKEKKLYHYKYDPKLTQNVRYSMIQMNYEIRR
jgi:hypothetical protein